MTPHTGYDVTHLQVRKTENLTVQMMLEDCGRVAAVMEGAPDLRNKLVWVKMQSDGHDNAKRSLACLKLLLESRSRLRK
jgi:hypothetical protein